LQIRVRGGVDDYPGAWQRINDVKEALLGLPSQDLEGDRWTAVNTVGDIVYLGHDEKSRPEFTLNFRCIVEPAVNSSAYMHRESL
jgi:hypothetical protein